MYPNSPTHHSKFAMTHFPQKNCLQTNCLLRKNSKQEKLDMENNVEEKIDFINEKTEVKQSGLKVEGVERRKKKKERKK